MSTIGNKIGFVSLGCPKALVDSERILSNLRSEGYEITPSYADADLVVVNTCGFIDAAVEESLDAIGEAIDENGKVIVTGCLGNKGNVVKETHPDVLAVTGPHATEEVVQLIHRHIPPIHHPRASLLPPGGIKLTARHYAYIKIAEGCNHRCSFCIIPSLRGDLVSRPITEVLTEAENLVSAGVRELLVVSQDTSAYGVDLRYRPEFHRQQPLKTNMLDLCRALGDLGVWVRLHYVYPYPHVDQVVPLMAQGRILPYLDIPFQHASPRILKLMRRPANIDNTLERIQNWRATCPALTIRSTFIVGFPGETEAEFEELLEFLQQARLDRVGAFAYSPVDGAAANQLPGALPDQVRQSRLERFMAVQESISTDRLQEKLGQQMIVLIDDKQDDMLVCRSEGDAPEIDGQVMVTMDPDYDFDDIHAGDFIEVKITDADEHNLYARILGE